MLAFAAFALLLLTRIATGRKEVGA